MSEGDVRYPALIAGPLLGALVYGVLPEHFIAPDGAPAALAPAAKATIAIIVWMAVWWFTEAVHIAVTSLLPLVLFPLTGVADIKTTAGAYASDLIFLFIGGFILGMSIHRWHLDKRIALAVLLMVGEKPQNIVAGFMLVAAFLSAFISNTATTVMLLPIALSVLSLRRPTHSTVQPPSTTDDFPTCLLIATAYAASLGGISTIIGTAPNVFTVNFIQNMPATEAVEISFVGWMKMALPVSLTLLVACWLLLTRFVFRLDRQPSGIQRKQLLEQYRALGPMRAGEWISLGVFTLAATLWIARPAISQLAIEIAGISYSPLSGLSDAGIAMFAALLLFVLPAGNKQAAMDWQTATRLPWGVIILLGGGFALAQAVKSNGIDLLLGNQVAGLAHLPDFAVLLLLVAVVVFLTEFTSNTATTAVLIPAFAAFAPSFDLPPLLLLIPATFAASCAFMMPIATPPNAVVFGSGQIRIPQMVRAGFWMNLIAIGLITCISWLWIA